MIDLRYYQAAAINDCYTHLQTSDGNPVIVIPTGGGKTAVIATLCSDAVQTWNGRVLVIAHVKELLQQTANTLQKMCPTIPVGVYSAGLKRRQLGCPVTVAGVQSVYNRAEELGRIDLVIVDEAHLIPPDGDGMYRTLIDALTELNPDVRVIGLTATPYRLAGGLIYGPDRLFEKRCYEIGVKVLVEQGYLSKLIGKAAVCEVDTDALKIVRGEYEEDQAEQAFTDVVGGAVDEVVSRTVDRRAVLLFCQTVSHGGMVAYRLRADLVGREESARAETDPAKESFGLDSDPLADHRLNVIYDWLLDNGHPVDRLTEWMRRGRAVVGEIYGDTPADERAALIEQFRNGTLRYLVNVNVLTTGFDAPNVDCVCLLRATVSPGLYYQMVGRGFRLSEGKKDCLVLDFGQNIKRHGPVDEVVPPDGSKCKGDAVTKMCPECRTVVMGGVTTCPDCGYAWPAREFEPKHTGRSGAESPISPDKPTLTTFEVLGVTYKPHTKKDAPPGHPKTLRVEYKTGVGQSVSEWVCVEHEVGSFANTKARQWWAKACNYPMPETAAEAAMVGIHGLLAEFTEVTTRLKPGEKYPSIATVKFSDRPRCPTPCRECGAVNKFVLMPSGNVFAHPGRLVCAMCDTHFAEVGQEIVDHYGYYDPINPPGMLPSHWVFDESEQFQSEQEPEPEEEEVPF